MKTTWITVKWVVVFERRPRLRQWLINFSSSSVKDLIWLNHLNSNCKIVSGILKCIHVRSHVDCWQSRCFFLHGIYSDFELSYHHKLLLWFVNWKKIKNAKTTLLFSFLSVFTLSTTLWPAGMIHGQPAHKQCLKQTDKAPQWKADGEGRMQIEEATTCKHDIVD